MRILSSLMFVGLITPQLTFAQERLLVDLPTRSGQTDLAALGLQGEVKGYIDRKDPGFSTFSESFDYDQTAWGLEGRVAVAERTELTFGGEELRRDDGRLERIARIGFAHQLDANRMIEAEIANDHHDAISRADDFGARTDAGLRLTWTRDEDLKAWIFGQTTLSRDATRRGAATTGWARVFR